MRRISNSEVNSWLTCRARYRYEFDMDLEKIEQSDALNIGNLGHNTLEAYYRERMDGAGHEDAIVEARKVLINAMSTNVYGMEIVTRVDALLQGYWANYANDNWQILAVEEQFDLPITDEYHMPTKLDLLVRTSDGKIWIVDHKFTYEFFTNDDLALNAQLPKYAATLKNLGWEVSGGIINQVRTRKMKAPGPDDLYRRNKIVASIAYTRNVLKQHITASREIIAYREQPEHIRKELATPVLNKYVCKMCSFRSVCSSELNGADVDYLIQNEYQRKVSYGYNKESEAQL